MTDKRGKCIAIAALLTACLLSVSCRSNILDSNAPKNLIHLRAQSWGGPRYMPRLMLEDVMKRLEASGRYQFDYFPAESLMSAKEAFDAVREGVLDIAISAAGYHEDRMKLVGAVQWMPRNFEFEEFAIHCRDPGGFLDFVQPYYERVGLRLLSDQHTPAAVLFSTKPVRRLEDMKGLLIRDVGAMSDWEKLLGAAPLAMASSDIYEGFQRGVLEANLGSVMSYLSNRWFEVAGHVTMINWFASGMQLIMNLSVYEGLPPDARELLDRVLIEEENAFWVKVRNDESALIESMKAKDVQIYYPSPDEMARWEAAIQPYYDNLARRYGGEWQALMAITENLK